MEGGIDIFNTILLVAAVASWVIWFIVRDDKKPKKSTQTIVQDITVNVKLDKESIELLADAIKKDRERT